MSVLTAAQFEVDWRIYLADLDEGGKRLTAEAREALSGVPEVEAVAVPAPSPPRELDRQATERHARVVVLGPTHRGMLGRVLPGTVADPLLSGAPCPVAVAPREFSSRDARPASIAVGLDGTTEARIAVAEASRIAQATGATLALICVFDPRDPLQTAEAALGCAEIHQGARRPVVTDGDEVEIPAPALRALQFVAEGMAAGLALSLIPYGRS